MCVVLFCVCVELSKCVVCECVCSIVLGVSGVLVLAQVCVLFYYVVCVL